jgi:hypothetical protein
MTLGLATADKEAIYFAIESEGLPQFDLGRRSSLQATITSQTVLTSKLIDLQAQPSIVLLASGDLLSWLEVLGSYQRSDSIDQAANKMQQRLDSFATTRWPEFGLLCGFEKSRAMYCRTQRTKNGPVEPSSPLDRVQPIGLDLIRATVAANEAQAAIDNGVDPLRAIADTIGRHINEPQLRGPIHTMILRP